MIRALITEYHVTFGTDALVAECAVVPLTLLIGLAVAAVML